MKAALYARVSSEEQVEGYSIDAQKRSFQSLARDKGWETYREYVDEGKSARTDDINKRPAFKEMITDALAGRFDVIVVHKLDRFARNLRITLEYFDKLSKTGISFVSINENMDFPTPWGRLALTLLGGLAQFYSDNLSQETKKGWRERKEQGLYCGMLPFGAVKGEDGIPVPDMQEKNFAIDGQGVTLRNYKEKAKINAQLDRQKKLFSWGDITEGDYLSEKNRLVKELHALTLPDEPTHVLEELSEFLRHVTKTWKEANQQQRNSLARQLFEEIWVKDKQVVAVKPRPELEPFFRLSYEEWLKKFESGEPKPAQVAISLFH